MISLLSLCTAELIFFKVKLIFLLYYSLEHFFSKIINKFALQNEFSQHYFEFSIATE